MSHDGPADGDTSVFMHGVKPIGKIRAMNINDKAKINKLSWYVLNNYNEVGPMWSKYDFLYADLLFPILRMKYYQ